MSLGRAQFTMTSDHNETLNLLLSDRGWPARLTAGPSHVWPFTSPRRADIQNSNWWRVANLDREGLAGNAHHRYSVQCCSETMAIGLPSARQALA
jgi:hypothetical protein